MTPRKDEDAYRHFTTVMRLRIEWVTYSEVNMSVEFLYNCVVGANPTVYTTERLIVFPEQQIIKA